MKRHVFTVMVADLTASRELPDRRQFARSVQTTLRKVSEQFRQEFYAPFSMTRGIDEFSGVLHRAHASFRIARLVNALSYPREFRFAIVRGELDVNVSTRHAGRMDGPAFHVAADLIKHAKSRNWCYAFSFGQQLETTSLVITTMTNLHHIITGGWSERQRMIVQQYESLGVQKLVSDRLRITQQAVSSALITAHWKDVKSAETLVEHLLAGLDRHKPENLYSKRQGLELVPHGAEGSL